MSISLSDIAKEAGVSTATVSLVLSDKAAAAGIAKSTHEKVRQVARRLNYRPNLMARGLRTRQTFTLGLLFHNPRELIYAELISNIHALLRPYGYACICAFWDDNLDAAGEAFRTVVDRGVDLLITSHDDVSLIPPNIPAVLLFQDDGINDCISRDSRAGMQKAVNCLLELGHRRIGGVNLNPKSLGRLASEMLAASGCDVTSFWAHDPDGDYLAGSRRCLATLLDLPPETRPTALICRNDTVAMVAMSEAGRRGLNVPRDISVIGFDGVTMGALSNPPLTSVGVPPAELARETVALMMRRLKNPAAPRQVIKLVPDLTLRESCAPAPQTVLGAARGRVVAV